MSCWCRGTIRIDGLGKNIARFINEVILTNDGVAVENKDDLYRVISGNLWYNGFGNMYSTRLNRTTVDIEGDISARYNFDIENIVNMSKEYSIEVIIVAGDYMNGFMQIIRVVNGEVELNYVGKNNTLTYSYESQEYTLD